MEAINHLRSTAVAAVNKYDMCTAVSLDIRNAFNSIGWGHVMEALAWWETPPYMVRLLQSYFQGRTAEIASTGSREGKLQIAVTCGVPQGSVIGPLLWNLTYDQVLRVELPVGASLIGFADDTLVVATGETSEEVEDKVNTALSLVAG